MNILQVLPELNAGGVERTTIEIAQALNERGHVPHVVCAGGRLEDELSAAGGILHRLDIGSKNPLSLPAHTKALIEIIQTHNIDIVHARSRAPAWPAKAAAHKTQTPFVTTYHGIYNANNPLKRFYNSVMAAGDVIIANSQFTKDHIRKEHGTDPDKIVVIPRGVDMVGFDPQRISPSDIGKIRLEWGVGDAPIILLPGRLTRWKGQLVGVKALQFLDDDVVLVLLGDAQGRDAYVDEIMALAQELGVTERVVLAAHSRDMPTALSASDVVISASTDPEAFGRVMAEAQAMEKLVVASNHGGARETVLDGEGGYLVPPNDAKALADGISKILHLPKSTYKTRAQKARQRILANFSAKALQSATLGVYENVLRGSARK